MIAHFFWRLLRNMLAIVPITRSLLFPGARLAERFGPSNASYAILVFREHNERLRRCDFPGACRVLEVGPGRNLGTALLWWADLSAATQNSVEVWCWDVYRNAVPEGSFWYSIASQLLAADASNVLSASATDLVRKVAAGELKPAVKYVVVPLEELESMSGPTGFDLVYSQAAIEHIWSIDAFWEAVSRLSSRRAWHSHRIDLADHGSRDSNYLEFLQWSPAAYWLTMRFIPGACNRWRACHHIEKLRKLGFAVLLTECDRRKCLPVPQKQLAREFRELAPEELRISGLSIIARRLES